MLVHNASDPGGDKGDGIGPGDLFPPAIFTNHRPGDTVRGGLKVEGIPAFDTKVSFADRRFEGGTYSNNLVFSGSHMHLASSPAVRAGCLLPLGGTPAQQERFVLQRAGRARIHTRPATHARTFEQG